MSRRRPGEATATGGFGALPWSGAQAAEAAAWFPGSPAPLLGSAAREQAVRDGLASARVVHFATHGILDDAPLLACVVLAEGDTLDVWELLGLPLDADLVTFSSCDSAGTPVTPGDEVVGLAWLTLAAGARAVVASLWKVAELSTALLMRAFYGALRDGRRRTRRSRPRSGTSGGSRARPPCPRSRRCAPRRSPPAAPTRASPATRPPSSHTRFTGPASC